jgi:DNA-binding transcriptional MerR regulator
MTNSSAGFTASELLRAVPGLKYPTLNFWIISGLLDASAREASGKGSVRRFTLDDAIAARVILALRGSTISLQALRKVATRLRAQHRQPTDPWAAAKLIVIPGAKPDVAKVIVTDDAETVLISLLRSPNQQMMTPVVLPLEPLVREVRARIVEIQRARDERDAVRAARLREQQRQASARYQARLRERRVTAM